MAKYKVLELSFINNSLIQAGAVVEYSGKAGKNLELVEDESKGKKQNDEKPKG